MARRSMADPGWLRNMISEGPPRDCTSRINGGIDGELHTRPQDNPTAMKSFTHADLLKYAPGYRDYHSRYQTFCIGIEGWVLAALSPRVLSLHGAGMTAASQPLKSRRIQSWGTQSTTIIIVAVGNLVFDTRLYQDSYKRGRILDLKALPEVACLSKFPPKRIPRRYKDLGEHATRYEASARVTTRRVNHPGIPSIQPSWNAIWSNKRPNQLFLHHTPRYIIIVVYAININGYENVIYVKEYLPASWYLFLCFNGVEHGYVLPIICHYRWVSFHFSFFID